MRAGCFVAETLNLVFGSGVDSNRASIVVFHV